MDKNYFYVVEQVFEDGKIDEYYWQKQKLYQLFYKILRHENGYGPLRRHLAYCWYIARKMTADIYASECPDRELMNLEDELEQQTHLNASKRKMIWLAYGLISMTIELRDNALCSDNDKLQEAADRWLPKLQFDMAQEGRDCFKEYFVVKNESATDDVDYKQPDAEAARRANERICTDLNAEKNMTFDEIVEYNMDLMFVDDLKQENTNMALRIKELEKENEELKALTQSVELKRSDGKGGCLTKTITAREVCDVVSRYPYKEGLTRDQMKDMLAGITGLGASSFQSYLGARPNVNSSLQNGEDAM